MFTISYMRSIWRTLDRETLSGIAAVCLAVAVIGISYGTTAVAEGFPVWLPVLLGTVVLAGGAEFLFIGIVAAGGNPIAATLAGLLVNARHLPYGLSVPDVVGIGWRRLIGVHVMNDEAVAMALAESEPDRRRAVYWACGLGVLLAWPGGAALGALIGTVVPDTSVLGLDAVFPAVLLALVIPALRDRTTFGAVCFGTGVAVLSAPFLPAGLPVLLALSGVVVAAITLGRGASDVHGTVREKHGSAIEVHSVENSATDERHSAATSAIKERCFVTDAARDAPGLSPEKAPSAPESAYVSCDRGPKEAR